MPRNYDPEHFDTLATSLTAMSIQSEYLTGRLQDGKTNVRVSLVNDETKQLMDYLQARSVKSSPKAISATKTSVYDSPYRSMRYGMNNVLEGLSSCEHHCRESYGHTQQGMDILRKKYGHKAGSGQAEKIEVKKPKLSSGQNYISSALERRAKRDAMLC